MTGALIFFGSIAATVVVAILADTLVAYVIRKWRERVLRRMGR